MGPRKISAAALLIAGAAFFQLPAPARLLPAAFCRLYLDPHDKFTRVVPAQRSRNANALTAGAALSTITVNYRGFTSEAQIAFQAAVDIWRSQVGSSIPIVIDATFANLGDTLLLGSAGPTCVFRDFTGAIRPGTWFVSPIAERLTGQDLTRVYGCSVASDIVASFNSNMQAGWYFGTDGVPQPGQVDFVTVVLHELGHGLGFIGTGTVSGGIGTVGFATGGPGLYPYIYDANVVDSAGTSILDSSVYPNLSGAMAALIQGTGASGPGLFWGGGNAFTANGGARPVLYAPGSFQDGSSFSHLDETTYPAGNLNSLMTPILGQAEVIHTPGPAMLGMLTDMGWGNQTGSSCSFGLDNYTAVVPAAGGPVSVELVTAAGCAWTASTSDTFVSGLTPVNGSNSARLQMTVAANTNSGGRLGTVTIGTETFTIAQRGTSACSYSLSPAGVSVGPDSQTGTISLTAGIGCTWTATTNDSSVATIATDRPWGQGSATIGYSISHNAGQTSRATTLVIGGQSFSVSQSAGPTMSVDRVGLTFGVVGAYPNALETAPQTIHLVQSGLPGTVTWTAETAGWLTVTPTSGTGSANLTVSVDVSLAGRQRAIVGGFSITLTGAANTAIPVVVTLLHYDSSSTGPPQLNQSVPAFGAFDTPPDGATGLAGSVPLTGWSLDDVQVARVAICRDPVVGETLAAEPRCNNSGQAYIGDAAFIDGARPDVERSFLSYPLSTRGGWGYLLLTNSLPNTGNGTCVLSAYATDVEGHTTLLGTKTITLDNAHSIAPFGAIDTPGQGEVVSGVVANYGWVLSPGSRRADPPGGGTVTVFVDGAPVGSPGGWNSRSDLTALFPVSQYAGVGTALGVFGLDTTALTNGVHTISWSVTDNFGVTSGIGSRFFGVSNGSVLLGRPEGLRYEVPSVVGRVLRPATEAAIAGSQDPAYDFLVGRRGFDLETPRDYYFADAYGVIAIDARELDRIELQLEPGATGALVTPEGEKPLPIGAQIDPATGVFTWAPAAGYIGRYDFALGPHRVRVVIH